MNRRKVNGRRKKKKSASAEGCFPPDITPRCLGPASTMTMRSGGRCVRTPPSDRTCSTPAWSRAQGTAAPYGCPIRIPSIVRGPPAEAGSPARCRGPMRDRGPRLARVVPPLASVPSVSLYLGCTAPPAPSRASAGLSPGPRCLPSPAGSGPPRPGWCIGPRSPGSRGPPSQPRRLGRTSPRSTPTARGTSRGSDVGAIAGFPSNFPSQSYYGMGNGETGWIRVHEF